MSLQRYTSPDYVSKKVRDKVADESYESFGFDVLWMSLREEPSHIDIAKFILYGDVWTVLNATTDSLWEFKHNED